MTTGAKRRAVFLDRDGTVIHDVGYPRDPEQVSLISGAAVALARLQQAGFALIIISNQSGIGRGWIRPEDAKRVHSRVVAVLSESGVRLDGAYYCPHAPDGGCSCRKPAPGLILTAADELGIDTTVSFIVGDKPSDIEAGTRAGCRTVLLKVDRDSTSAPVPRADCVADNWDTVLTFILAHSGLEA